MSAVPSWRPDDTWSIFSLKELAEGDLDSYLQKVATEAATQFGASGASIFLSDDHPGRFHVRARAGRQSTVPPSAVIVRGEGVAGRVVSGGTARILGDIANEPDLQDISPPDWSEVSSSLVVPLSETSGEIVGVLNLSRHKGSPQFAQTDLDRAVAIATMISLAVANARLLDSLKQQMLEVKRTSDKLQAVFDSVGSALIVIDDRGVVIECNAPARDFFSNGDGSWVGSEAFAPALQSAFERIKRTGNHENVRVMDAQTGRTWLLHGTPISSGGMVLAVIDLTEHEAVLRESERLRRLAEIGQMTAAVAHEIRNPLTGIRSAAQVIRDDPEMADEFLGVIEEEVLKLNALCEEFLAFARPMELDRQQVDLAAIVQTVCERNRSDFEKDGVELVVVTGSNMPTMNLDRRRIEQVVHNLLRNARQACKPGCKVEVLVEDGRLTVSDDGQGISGAQMERLFSPFFTTKADGTGLGLCNVRRIVDAHGAKVAAQSSPGGGSRFTVDFERSDS